MEPLKLLLILDAVLVASVSEIDLDVEWDNFKAEFKKEYRSNNEAILRRQIWEDNLRTIREHNDMADRGKYTYRLGMNKYGDMTNKEFNTIMNRLHKDNKNGGTTLKTQHGLKLTDLPKTVDWRNQGYVTEVKDQGYCGSCYAFSATGALEGQHFKKTGKLKSLSEQNILDCSYPQGNNGCYGGFPYRAFEYVVNNSGVAIEQVYPYVAREHIFPVSCRFHEIDRLFIGATATGYVNVPSRNETALQIAVATAGPISVSIDGAWTSFQLYKSGIYNEPNCSTSEMNHAVLAVGYGTDVNGSYWLVKNSWGTSWGMDGYVLMSRNKDNQCGISTMAAYPTM